MTACDRIIPLLSFYLEGDTSPAEATLIRSHLKACGECRSEYADLKATVELVRGLPRIDAPDGFEAGVLARLRSAGVAEVGAQPVSQDADEYAPAPARAVVLEGDWGQERWWEGWLPRFAAAAAAATVVALSMVGTHEFAQHQKTARSDYANRLPGGGSGAPGGVVSSSLASSRVASSSVASSGAAPGGVGLNSSAQGGGAPSTLSGADGTSGRPDGMASLEGGSRRNPQYDDLRNRFPDIPAEVIGAMPLNGETYAADRLVAQPWSSAAGGQLLAPVDYHGEEKVYIYR